MKHSTGIILALLLLAFALRLWGLSTQSIWWDEAFTWQIASHDFANFWQTLLTGDRNPPLYFASVALWGSVGGWSEFSLRFISVVWSMVGLVFLFNLANRAYDTSVGWWALALATVAPALVVYAQEARMYAAFFALTAATLYFAWCIFDSGNERPRIGNRKLSWAFVLCEAGLLLTHYFAIPLVLTLNLFALIVLIHRRAHVSSYARWIGGQILAVLPIVIWTLIVFATPGSLIKAQETPPDIFAFADQVVMLWFSGVRDLHGEWMALPWLAWLLLPVALIGAWLVNRRSTRWLIGLTGVSLIMAYTMTLLLTSFHPRYALPYSVPLIVILGAALSNLSIRRSSVEKQSRGKRWLVGAVTASLLLIAVTAGGLAASAPASAKDDARGVAAYLKQNAAATDVILLEANDYTLRYYDHGPAQTKMIMAATETEALQQLADAIGSAKRVWLPHWVVSEQDPRGYWPFLLEQSGRLRDWTSFQGYELYRYDMQSALHEPALVDHVAADQSPVQRVALDHDDTAITAAVEWQVPVRYYDPAKVSLRLIDARGNGLVIRDVPLLNDLGQKTDQWMAIQPVTNYYVLPIPPGTSPGTYTVTTQLYNGHDVLSEDVLGMVSLPRHLDTSDPYRTLAGYAWEASAEPVNIFGLELESLVVGTHTPWRPMPIDVTLRWRKTGETENVAPRLRLAQANRVWGETGSLLLEHDYPIGQWAIGETVIDRLKIGYPPLRGPIELQIGQGDQWATLTTLQLDESQMMFSPPQMQHVQAAQFDGFAALLGYDLKSDSLVPDRPLPLTLYWRAANTEPITTPYTVFTQILAPDGHLVAQHDAPPAPPTTAWVPGQIVFDEHPIKVIDPAYRGPATLIIGWYNSASVERVPVASGSDYVILQTPIRVEDK